jgi:hypothetical protein
MNGVTWSCKLDLMLGTTTTFGYQLKNLLAGSTNESHKTCRMGRIKNPISPLLVESSNSDFLLIDIGS